MSGRPLYRNLATPHSYGALFTGATPVFNPPPTPAVQAFSLTPMDAKGRPIEKKASKTSHPFYR